MIAVLTFLAICAFGVLWLGAWWLLGWPLLLCGIGAFITGSLVIAAVDGVRDRGQG